MPGRASTPGPLTDDQVARQAADDAGLPGPELLGSFPAMVRSAAGAGRRLRPDELRRCGELGSLAAREGTAARALVDLYLSVAWRLWRDAAPIDGDPREVALWVLRAVDDGVAALIEGMQQARADRIRFEEGTRHDIVEGLLGGGRQAVAMAARAEGLGLPLTGSVAVLLADSPDGRLDGPDGAPLPALVERALAGRYADATPLVILRDGRLVVIAAAPSAEALAGIAEAVASVLAERLGPHRSPGAGWLAAISSPRPGATAVRAAWLEADDALDLTRRAGLPGPVVYGHDLALFRLLLRDREAAWQLVVGTLDGLRQARGGGRDLLRTLSAYLDAGGNATLTAATLHLSVRAVTYRLQRIAELIHRDPGDLNERLTLHTAVTAAKLLDWPEVLPAGGEPGTAAG